jgi:myosin-15
MEGTDDMNRLTDLTESSLLWNLKVRYENHQIYTYTGSILVAVNPYKMLDIYNIDMVRIYENNLIGNLPPLVQFNIFNKDKAERYICAV